MSTCAEHPRSIASAWIAERCEARDLPALSWLIQQAAAALLRCFPDPQRGKDALWALFRLVAGPEPTREQGGER